MRRSLSLLAVLLIATSSAAAARLPGELGDRKDFVCRPGHGYLIAADARAKVYEQTGRPGVLACAYGSRRSYRLGASLNSTVIEGGVRSEALASTVVAYESFASPREGPFKWRVLVRDLRSGRILHRVATGEPVQPAEEEVGVGPVITIVVKSDGAAAWIAHDFHRSSGVASSRKPYFDVEAADKTGTRLLASGIEINPQSLALAGSTVYWTQGGKPFSAPMR
jgi:hypothetical protein